MGSFRTSIGSGRVRLFRAASPAATPRRPHRTSAATVVRSTLTRRGRKGNCFASGECQKRIRSGSGSLCITRLHLGSTYRNAGKPPSQHAAVTCTPHPLCPQNAQDALSTQIGTPFRALLNTCRQLQRLVHGSDWPCTIPSALDASMPAVGQQGGDNSQARLHSERFRSEVPDSCKGRK